MKLDEFSTFVQSHDEIEGLGILFGAEESEDRLLVKRRSDGGIMAIGPRSVVDADRSEIERKLLSGVGFEAPAAEALAGAHAWTRSHFGLLKDRLVRAYSVETLIAR